MAILIKLLPPVLQTDMRVSRFKICLENMCLLKDKSSNLLSLKNVIINHFYSRIDNDLILQEIQKS